MEEKKGKWSSDKRKIGVASFVALLIGYIVDANDWVVIPQEVTYILGAITMTWLAVEGLIDMKKVDAGEQEPSDSYDLPE